MVISDIVRIMTMLMLSSCCGMGAIQSVEEITYSKKSSLHPKMTLSEAEIQCQIETDGALNIWKRQCADPSLPIATILDASPALAKRMTTPIEAEQHFKWYCEDIQNIQHYDPNAWQRLDSSYRFQLVKIRSTCIQELGFKEYKNNAMNCRASFFRSDFAKQICLVFNR